MNVVNFLQHWIRHHFEHDFKHNAEFCDDTKKFIKIIEKTDGKTVANVVLKGMDKTVIIYLSFWMFSFIFL